MEEEGEECIRWCLLAVDAHLLIYLWLSVMKTWRWRWRHHKAVAFVSQNDKSVLWSYFFGKPLKFEIMNFVMVVERNMAGFLQRWVSFDQRGLDFFSTCLMEVDLTIKWKTQGMMGDWLDSIHPTEYMGACPFFLNARHQLYRTFPFNVWNKH